MARKKLLDLKMATIGKGLQGRRGKPAHTGTQVMEQPYLAPSHSALVPVATPALSPCLHEKSCC